MAIMIKRADVKPGVRTKAELEADEKTRKNYDWKLKRGYRVIDETMSASFTSEDRDNFRDVISVDAVVGSGKTGLARYAHLKFIEKHKDKKTFQMFVCPRIKLTHQQCEDYEGKPDENGVTSNTGLMEMARLNGMDTSVIGDIACVECHCKSEDARFKNIDAIGESLVNDDDAKHIIVFICDDSLWGDPDSNTPDESTLNKWMKLLANNEANGRKNGFIIYDESHNYSKRQLEILGERMTSTGEIDD